jgi:hypothetical protein
MIHRHTGIVHAVYSYAYGKYGVADCEKCDSVFRKWFSKAYRADKELFIGTRIRKWRAWGGVL